MKALCVRQPYAELIARGIKPLEIRTWDTPHRGPLLIVASSQAWREDMPKWSLGDADCPRSVAVCVVDLIEVRRARPTDAPGACCDITRGDLAWVLARPRRVEPFPVRGKLRLFEIPDGQIRIVGDGPMHTHEVWIRHPDGKEHVAGKAESLAHAQHMRAQLVECARKAGWQYVYTIREAGSAA